MKIAGIAGGSNRGEVVELTEEKKILAAVKEGVNKWAENYKDGKYLAFCTEIVPTDSTSSPHGDPLKGKWANNIYRARGTLKLHLRNKEKDTQLEPRDKKFTILFYDSLDSMGLPDLDVESLTL